MPDVSPISSERFDRAQAAEQKAWSRRAHSADAVRHEMLEHSEVAAPFRALAGARVFDRALEVGVGMFGLGFLGVHVGDRIKHLDGLDPLPRVELRTEDPELQQQVETLRSRVHYIQAPGEHLPFPDDSYDLVACINVIDHGRDPAAILREINRVLKPDGLLVFGVSTLSRVGYWRWKIGRRIRPAEWLYVAHPHIFQWRKADQLLKTCVSGTTLWNDRPAAWRQLAGPGRMSFWILQKS